MSVTGIHHTSNIIHPASGRQAHIKHKPWSRGVSNPRPVKEPITLSTCLVCIELIQGRLHTYQTLYKVPVIFVAAAEQCSAYLIISIFPYGQLMRSPPGKTSYANPWLGSESKRIIASYLSANSIYERLCKTLGMLTQPTSDLSNPIGPRILKN